MAVTTNDVATEEEPTETTETTETTKYFLLLPETSLPDSVLWNLPASVTKATTAPETELGWEAEVRVKPGSFHILKVDTETNELQTAKGGSVVHPEPAGEYAFSTADEMTLKLRHSFTGAKKLSADDVFALDTACFSLERGIGSQFTIDRRGE